MKSFKEYLSEKYVNLLPQHEDEKRKRAPEVFDMIHKAYESQGGIHGDGFRSHEDMVKNIPFWKLHYHGGKLKSVSMYKDTHGRKRCAVATDATPGGLKSAISGMKDDVSQKRSYGEVSGKALSVMKKHVPDFHKHIKTYDEAKKIQHDKEFKRPPHDDPEVIRHPEFKDHFYQRNIGGHWHTKLMYGTHGKKIT